MKTEDAIRIFGSKAKVAAALGIGRAAVSLWGDRVPPARQYQLHILTDGVLKLDRELRYREPAQRRRAA